MLAVFTVLVLMFTVVLPAIALSIAGPIRDARTSFTTAANLWVPSVVGLNYESAETRVRDSTLNIRISAHRYDVPNERCKIIFRPASWRARELWNVRRSSG